MYSRVTKSTVLFFKGTLCCSYGPNGMAVSGYDCLMIPGARSHPKNDGGGAGGGAPIGNPALSSQFCGNAGLVFASRMGTGGTAFSTICCE